MSRSVSEVVPETVEEAAVALREAAEAGTRTRFVGGGTKIDWASPAPADVFLSSARLADVREHNAADLTAVLQAGVRLSDAQKVFATAGQMLAVDPCDPGGSTIGGIVATADSGPLRHRYGGVRDLILGTQVALSDGTVARSGGRVIKNVAGYDLGKLFAGSFGTLGLIAEVAVRLHPIPAARATALGRSDDVDALERAALSVGRAPLELESFDVAWENEVGALLSRSAGLAASERSAVVAELMAREGLEVEVVEDDENLWTRQRMGQRAESGGVSIRVSAVRSEFARVVEAARSEPGRVVGRAGIGLHWVTFPAGADDQAIEAVARLRRALAPRPCVIQDAPEPVRAVAGVWEPATAGALMRDVKARFDPAGACAPGTFVGGI